MKNKSSFITLSVILCITLGIVIGFLYVKLTNPNNSIPTSASNVNHNSPSNTNETSSISRYTGENLSSSEVNNIPFMVIVENSKDARPQSGLSSADIVYETMAEGGIPRFIALFHKNSPDKIGPVRSVRPYFIDIASEYDLPFAHCGGSNEALSTISSSKTIKSINEMANGSSFWRDNSRKAPHNLYTSANNIRDLINKKNISAKEDCNLKFNNEFWDNIDSIKCESLNLKLNKFYSTSYKYKDSFYEKSMDGSLTIDYATNSPLKFKNVIIQLTDIKTQSDGLHIDIKLVGSNKAIIFSQGKYINCTWSKDTKSSKTILKDEKGNIIPLTPGNTIWHIVDINTISINQS